MCGWQEEDIQYERDASGKQRELGTGAFGKVRSRRRVPLMPIFLVTHAIW